MMTHTHFLNALSAKNDFQTYTEIGIFNTDHNFNKINVPHKIGVDPAEVGKSEFYIFKGTSDEFFESKIFGQLNSDLWFLDGLHHADQIKKDFENALARLSDGGFIMMHDCNPHSEHITHVPRDNGEWCGDVYTFASTLNQYNGIDFVTIDADYGCALVWKDVNKIASSPLDQEITWEYFQENKQELLRLITVEQFKERFL